MRVAMRVLVYLALPSVAFAWLLQVDFPVWPGLTLDSGFSDHRPGALLHLVEALEYAVLGAVVVAVIVAIVKLLGVGAPPPRGQQGISR